MQVSGPNVKGYIYVVLVKTIAGTTRTVVPILKVILAIRKLA